MFKNVTDNQGLGFARMARAKGVSRQQFAASEEDGTLGRILDGIKAGMPITIGTPLIPPIGGCIHIVKVRKLKLDREWWDAVGSAGPDIGRHSKVLKVGDLYPPTGTGVVEEEHILLNYPDGDGGFDNALAWATQFSLVPNDPRRVFGMAKQHRTLHHNLGMSPMYVVAPIACSFDGGQQACCVWWGDMNREAYLNWTFNFSDGDVWFSFRKQVAS